MTEAPGYIGRFAPSPTGALHFGSLVAAVGSYLQARSQQGKWLIRFDDIDPPRVVPGSADNVLFSLETFGFEWDGPVISQIDSTPAHQAAIEQLDQAGQLYACACSRQEIAAHAQTGLEGTVYPGTCRDRLLAPDPGRALRVMTGDDPVSFADAVFGKQSQRLATDIGDFIVRRSDGLIAYQLAVVVDDARQRITEVVRGADLLLSTPRQIFLQRLLGLPTPRYLHLPLALGNDGRKLSKRLESDPLDPARPSNSLTAALDFLGQQPPVELSRTPIAEIWSWAIAHWDTTRIPRDNRRIGNGLRL